MPLSLAKLQANRAEAAIDFGDGDVLHVTYYPRKITGEMFSAYASLGRATKDVQEEEALAALDHVLSVTETLAAILAAWDLTDTDKRGNEVPVPVDRAHIKRLGLAVQWAIFNGIMEASATGEASARTATMDAPSASSEA